MRTSLRKALLTASIETRTAGNGVGETLTCRLLYIHGYRIHHTMDVAMQESPALKGYKVPHISDGLKLSQDDSVFFCSSASVYLQAGKLRERGETRSSISTNKTGAGDSASSATPLETRVLTFPMPFLQVTWTLVPQ